VTALIELQAIRNSSYPNHVDLSWFGGISHGTVWARIVRC